MSGWHVFEMLTEIVSCGNKAIIACLPKARGVHGIPFYPVHPGSLTGGSLQFRALVI